tara:strand:+ start:248 stop:601 length:354 start_codon:yes stop_codon:yes gene_type:complete
MKDVKTYWETEQFDDNLWIGVEYVKLYYSVDSFDKMLENVMKQLKHNPASLELEMMKYMLPQIREYYESKDGEWIDDDPIYSTVTDACNSLLYEGLDYCDAEKWCYENMELYNEDSK